MNSLLKKVIPFFIILFLCTWALLPLLRDGFFTMHDDQQIARLYELHDGITGGQFPVRWVSHLGFGFGYPLFNFYPPLIYYVGLLFYFLGFSLIISTKIMLFLGFFLSAIFMYLWVNKHFGKVAGITAAVLYVYAPYHIVDIYVRGAFSEFFSFVWIPAVFWSFDMLSEKKNGKWVIVTSLFLSFVVLTHNLIALPFLFFLFPYLLFLLLQNKKEIKKTMLLFFITGILSLGFSSFFWLPALMEKKYTLVDRILTRELASYTIHFVKPFQLWQSEWAYGGSSAGIDDGLSFKVGKIHLLASLLALLSSLVFLRKKKNQGITFLCFSLLMLSLFMTIDLSKFIWDSIKPLAYLQFPWRFLLFSSVFSAFLGGAFIGNIEKSHKGIGIVGSIGIIASAIWLMRPYIQPQQYLSYGDENYIKNKDIEWRISSSSFEYMSKDTATTISRLQTTIVDVKREEIPVKSYETKDKNLKITEVVNTPSYKKYLTDGKGTLQINTNYFPGWIVLVDNKEMTITPRGKFRVITVPVEGKRTVEAKFTNTPTRTVANGITVLSVAGTGFYLLKRRKAI